MSLAFIDRKPTKEEVEKLRLLLSTFQDGTGQLAISAHRSLPLWRDFERSVALAFIGSSPENKGVFDVLIPDPCKPNTSYGLSCKMKDYLDTAHKKGNAYLELTNPAGKFWDELAKYSITSQNYKSGNNPSQTGKIIIDLVKAWHEKEDIRNGGSVDLAKSYYLSLLWSKKNNLYQLFQLDLNLPDPRTLQWHCPSVKRGGKLQQAKHIKGTLNSDILFDWFGESGGQLKYYPLLSTATWYSDPFHLEPLPRNVEKRGLEAKVTSYFPTLWEKACI